MVEKLDAKDKQILYQLDLNSRQSFNQIAKKVGLSREVVQYRIKQLEKRGIIKGYQALIDVSKLGYISCRFFIKFQNDTPQEEKEVIEYYKSHPKFWWVDSIDGFRDLGLACWVKNIYEFYEIKEDLVLRFGKFIDELSIAMYSKFYVYKRNYLSQNNNMQKPIEMFFPKKAEFDEKDMQILRMIAPNARANIVEISQKSGISVSSINYRIKNMEKNGIIKGFRANLGLEKLGFYWYKIEFQLEDISVKKSLLSYFDSNPNIVYAYETISENDLEVEMEVQSYEDFRKILDEIRNLFGDKIRRYHHLLWYKEHKFLFMP